MLRTHPRPPIHPAAPRRPGARAARPTLLALAATALLGGMLADAAQAKTVTWTGTAVNTSNWSNDLNWGGSNMANGDTLVFAGLLRTTNRNNLNNASINGLSFAAGAAAFTLNGNSLTNTGTIANRSSHQQTLNLGLIVGADQTWTGGSAGLQFGAISFASGASAGHAVGGSGTLTVMGGIRNDSSHVQTFDAVLTVGADQTWNLGNRGMRVAGLNGAGQLTLEGSGQWVLGSTVNASTASFAGLIAGANTNVIVDSLGGTQTLTGSGSSVSSLMVRRGHLVVGGGSFNANDYAQVEGMGTLQISGGAFTSAGAVNVFQDAHLLVDGGSVNTSWLRLMGGSALLSSGSIGTDQLRMMDSVLRIVGGQLTVRSTDRDSIAVDGDGRALFSVGGAGARVTTAGGMAIGADRGGAVQVADHGSLLLAGVLQVGGDENIESGMPSSLSVASAGTVTAGSVSIGAVPGSVGSVTVAGAGSTLTSLSALELGGDGGMAAGLVILDGGQVISGTTLLGSAGAAISINGGALVTGLLGGPAGSITLEDGDPALAMAALTFNGAVGAETFAGSLAGSGSVHKTGGSTQILAGANSFTGSVWVSGGTLEMSNGAASFYQASGGGTLKLNNGTLGWSAVQADAGGTVVYNTATLTGGTLLGEGTHDVSRVTRYVGTGVGSGTTLALANNTRLIGVVSAGTLNVAAGRSAILNGGSNAGGRFNVDGTANVAGWTSSGVLQVGTAGVLNVASSDLLLLGGSRTAVGSKAAPGGRIDLAAGHSIELNGALLVNNGTITGTTNVHYGSLAKGAGVYGAVNVYEGGVFEAGNSPGTVHTGATTWNAGGSYLVAMDLASGVAGVNSGLWQIDGALAITAGADGGHFTISVATLDQADQAITLADFNPHHDYSWLIASASGGITGYAPGIFSVDSSGFLNALDGGHFAVAKSGNHLMLNFTSAVPEPAHWALMLAGLAGLAWKSRRQRTRQAMA